MQNLLEPRRIHRLLNKVVSARFHGVNGNINAQTVVVRGKVNGNINAKEKIEIKTKAELFGDIRASKLSVEEGVTFVGKTEVNPNKISPTPSARPSEAPKTPEPGKPPGR